MLIDHEIFFINLLLLKTIMLLAPLILLHQPRFKITTEIDRFLFTNRLGFIEDKIN